MSFSVVILKTAQNFSSYSLATLDSEDFILQSGLL